MSRIVVYGAGGHGKVVADILLAGGQRPAGFVDDDPKTHGQQRLGLPVLGGFEWLQKQAAAGPVEVVLGIGGNQARQTVARRCLEAGVKLQVAVHPSATVAASARLGQGTVVMAGVVVNADAQAGEGVILNTGAVIEHDVVIGDYAHVSPNSTMGGAARLGVLSQLGIGAVVLPGVAVGSRTVVGGGAVVIRDLPDGVVAVGVPAAVREDRRNAAPRG